MALATVDDLELRLGVPVAPSGLNQAEAFLADASALVTSYTRQNFELTMEDDVVLRPVGTWLRLPQRPVLDVISVAAISGLIGGADLPLVGWSWDGSDLVNIDGWNSIVINGPDYLYDGGDPPNTFRVVYDHGYDPVPPAIVGVVCAMVNRVLSSPSPVEGLISERIGQYGYQLQQGSGSPGLAVRLTSADKEALEPYRRMNSTIAVHVR